MKQNGLNTETPFGFCLNVLEDYRQEKFGYEEYEGKKQIMSRGRELFAKSQRDNPLWEAPSDQMKDILRSLFLFDMHYLVLVLAFQILHPSNKF